MTRKLQVKPTEYDKNTRSKVTTTKPDDHHVTLLLLLFITIAIITILNCLLITKHQHGFIRKRSTCTNLLESLHDWTLNLQNKKKTDFIYFDFKKASDTVSHPKLLTKLKAYGLPDSLHFWVSEFLRERTQIVKINNNYSNWLSGVAQGSMLGPTLFLLLPKWCLWFVCWSLCFTQTLCWWY